MNGILIIDKPIDLTSHDVVARLRKILKTKKIGHTGTLDPFATGVLVMLVGKATRLAKFLDKDSKSYEAVIRFGFETDTGDRTGTKREGEKKRRRDGETLEIEQIESVLPDFWGEIEQIPPMYSAKKVKGKRLYELARKGVEIKRQPINVKIDRLEIDSRFKTHNSRLKTQDFKLEVSCSAGTYIRTLAEDIGRKLQVGCHLAELRRTKAGKFEISQAVSLEQLEEIYVANKLDEVLISMNEGVSHLPKITLSERDVKKTKNGMHLFVDEDFENESPIRMIDEQKNLVAIGYYQRSENLIQPKIVLV